MAKNIHEIAAKMGAIVVGQVSDAGGGAFGAAKLAHEVARLQSEMQPIRVSADTLQKLKRIAEQSSTPENRVTPLDVASQILESAVAALPET